MRGSGSEQNVGKSDSFQQLLATG